MHTVALATRAGDDRDTATILGDIRIRLLDAVTGEPVVHAYADRVMIGGEDMTASFAQRVETRAAHPFRVLQATDTKFRAEKSAKTKSRAKKSAKSYVHWRVPIQYLNKWKLDVSSNAFALTDESTGEFFDVDMVRKLADGDSYGRLASYPAASDGPTRWVKTATATGPVARRDLISDRDGVLSIPARITGGPRRYAVRFRDYVCLPAMDFFAHDNWLNRRLESAVKLAFDGTAGHRWVANAGEPYGEHPFEDEATIDYTGSALRREESEVDFTFWVLRRVQHLNRKPTSYPTNRQRGIVIHYNSGYGSEYSPNNGTSYMSCKNALNRHKNDFAWHPELPHALTESWTGKKSGYHYLIDRLGTIWIAAPELEIVGHAKDAEEPEGPEGDDPSKKKIVKAACSDKTKSGEFMNEPPDIALKRSNQNWHAFKLDELNLRFLGICLIGYHVGAQNHFNRTQVWYMKRLIEEIRNRSSGRIHWYRILGHDEVDPTKQKPDPGAALPGGMAGLRASFGACEEPANVSLRVTSTAGATIRSKKVWVEERLVEGDTFKRPPGLYFIRIRAVEHKEFAEEIRLTSGEQIVPVELRAQAILKINAPPVVNLKIDGTWAKRGEREWKFYFESATELEVEAHRRGFAIKRLRVTVSPGMVTEESISLEPS